MFSEGLLEQTGLDAQFRIHLLQPPVHVFHSRLWFSQTGGVHRAIWPIGEAPMPPYVARHLLNDALLMPCSWRSYGHRHTTFDVPQH